MTSGRRLFTRRRRFTVLTATAAMFAGSWLTPALLPQAAAATPGALAFTEAPSGDVAATYAAFAFQASGADNYDCSLDGATFDTCAGSNGGWHRVSGLALGAHTLTVRGVEGGVTGPTAATSWTVTGKPAVQIIDGPSGTTADRLAAFTFGPADVA